MSVAIGLDVGTSGVKALAVGETGEVLASAEEGYPLSTPRPGWAEQDPEDWWRATERALDRLGARDVAGIGLSGQMHGLVALDEADRVVRPAILWNDQRAAVECAEIEQRVGLERLIGLTGNREGRQGRLRVLRRSCGTTAAPPRSARRSRSASASSGSSS